MLRKVCRINYDGSKTCSRCCVGVKIKITLGVQEFVGCPDVRRKFYVNQPRSLGACYRSSLELTKKIIAKSRGLPGVHRNIAEGSSDVRRKYAESSPEEAIDAPEHRM